MDIVVLGAGVIGLTAALELSRRGFKVTIVGKDLPEDTESVGFASPWASLSARQPDLCRRATFVNVCAQKTDGPWFKGLTGDFQFLAGAAVPGGRPYGYTYTSYLINAPMYLQYLSSQARKLGVRMIRQRVASLAELYDLPGIGAVNLVVNASGLGAATLIGVEDRDVYPARGQTVLVRAPHAQRCIMSADGFGSSADGLAYIIPRPGPDGHVVLGGTYLADNYSSLPDLDEAERILKDCYKLEPLLAGPSGQSWKDIEIVSHNVGLRPARKGGARVELETQPLANLQGRRAGLVPGAAVQAGAPSRSVSVVHAYGFGGTGYQASVGAALEIAELVESCLGREVRARL